MPCSNAVLYLTGLDSQVPVMPRICRSFADKFAVSSYRGAWLLLGLFIWCGCTRPRADSSGRVTVSAFRAGSLPLGVSVCLDGVATYDDTTRSNLVVQDGTGGVRFGNVNTAADYVGRRVEVCGETRNG